MIYGYSIQKDKLKLFTNTDLKTVQEHLYNLEASGDGKYLVIYDEENNVLYRPTTNPLPDLPLFKEVLNLPKDHNFNEILYTY